MHVGLLILISALPLRDVLVVMMSATTRTIVGPHVCSAKCQWQWVTRRYTKINIPSWQVWEDSKALWSGMDTWNKQIGKEVKLPPSKVLGFYHNSKPLQRTSSHLVPLFTSGFSGSN